MTMLRVTSTVAILLGLAACKRTEDPNSMRTAGDAPAGTNQPRPLPSVEAVASGQGVARTALHDRRAKGDFESVKGVKLHGDAKLEETAAGVLIRVSISDAPPGTKGIHIHEKGDCSDIAGSSMGGHFNPAHVDHGLPGSSQRHPGDLGNIVIDKDGTGTLQITTEQGGLEPGGPTSFANRAIVIHESDDKGVQPTGGAGKPIACAVIQPS
jgi:Cu-Zn family superoxide dismutase